jgi:hypothetical protein
MPGLLLLGGRASKNLLSLPPRLGMIGLAHKPRQQEPGSGEPPYDTTGHGALLLGLSPFP